MVSSSLCVGVRVWVIRLQPLCWTWMSIGDPPPPHTLLLLLLQLPSPLHHIPPALPFHAHPTPPAGCMLQLPPLLLSLLFLLQGVCSSFLLLFFLQNACSSCLLFLVHLIHLLGLSSLFFFLSPSSSPTSSYSSTTSSCRVHVLLSFSSSSFFLSGCVF